MREWTDDEWTEAREERAAIREFDGGLNRTEAETLAKQDMRHLYSAAHPLTSRLAVESLAGTMDAILDAVANAIRAAGPLGLTCDEIETRLGLRHQTASARCSELQYRYRLIEPNGEKRKTRSGRFAQVYVARMEAPKQLDLAAGYDAHH